MYSLAGIGKTMASIQMPTPYIIDTESGTEHYADTIDKSGGAVFPTIDMSEIIDEVRVLMTTRHDFRSVVLDSATPPYEAKMMEGAEDPKIGDGYGRHIAYADRHMAKLFRQLSMIDMNVIVTAHAKDDWDKGEKRGIKFDGWKKLDYLFDLVLELQRHGKKRIAVVKKTRLAEFPDQEAFEWSFNALAERWGKENLERKAEVIKMATAQQVVTLEQRVKALNIDEATVKKWLKAADAQDFSGFTAEQILKAIMYCDKKIAEAVQEKEEAA
jgi:hypothetical protein